MSDAEYYDEGELRANECDDECAESDDGSDDVDPSASVVQSVTAMFKRLADADRKTKASGLNTMLLMSPGVVTVLGAQWGDEGKGKVVDVFAASADYVARCGGGNNAGHTLVVGDRTVRSHLVPSGLLNEETSVIIGNGVVVDVEALFAELDELEAAGVSTKGRVFVSDRAHLVLDYHRAADVLEERERGADSLGTTGRGIGPAYADKSARRGIRVHEFLDEAVFERKYRENSSALTRRFGETVGSFDAMKRVGALRERLRPLVCDTALLIARAVADNKVVIAEGANAVMLDIDHGTYPCVTSSNASVGGVCTGLGVPVSKVSAVVGVAKAYTTRVGNGPLPSEDTGAAGARLQEIGGEVGTTTGRARRCGWFDAVVLRYSNTVNGYTFIVLTKLDVLSEFDEIKVVTGYRLGDKELVDEMPASIEDLARVEPIYRTLPGWKTDIRDVRKWEDLPREARNYVKVLEELIGVPIAMISVGADRNALIARPRNASSNPVIVFNHAQHT